MEWQTVIAGIIVLAAVAAGVRWLWRTVAGAGRDACGNCGAAACPHRNQAVRCPERAAGKENRIASCPNPASKGAARREK